MFLGLSPHAASQEETVAVPSEVVELARNRAEVTTISGSFTYSTANPDEEPRRRQGVFHIVRGVAGQPTRYNLRLAKPDGSDLQRWCSDGIHAWIIEQPVPDLEPDIRQRKAGEDVDLRRMVDCVLVDLPALQRDFTISLASTPISADAGTTKWKELLLIPRNDELRKDLSRIVVGLSPAGEPDSIALHDGGGATIVVTLVTTVVNETIDEKLFRIR